jgi:hypothetical protein
MEFGEAVWIGKKSWWFLRPARLRILNFNDNHADLRKSGAYIDIKASFN